MDIDIQREENDLVVSTFGRGIYILDDYSPLRYMGKDVIKKDAYMFPIDNAEMYIESNPFGFRGVGFMGADFYTAENPKVGAVFTYYIKDKFKSLKDIRREDEKEKIKNKKHFKYPKYTQLKKEQDQPKAYLLFTVKDSEGNTVRKIKTDPKEGVNRLVWDFRYNVFSPISIKAKGETSPWDEPDQGYMVVPGKYNVTMTKFEDGQFTQLTDPIDFICQPLHSSKMTNEDKLALDEFNKKVAESSRTLNGADAYRKELTNKLDYFKSAVFETVDIPNEMYNEILLIEKHLDELNIKFHGDNLKGRLEGGSTTSIKDRIDIITGALWTTTSTPTSTYLESYKIVQNQIEELLKGLKTIDDEILLFEIKLEKMGAPYTPGRFPKWKK